MRLATRKQIYDWIRGIAQHEDTDLGKPVVRQPGVSKAIIPASYTSGNPQIQQWWESSATLGSKTHKIIQLYGSRLAAPAASDSIAIGHDPDGNKEILGKLVNVGSAVVDADYILGLRPVAPGNTLLLSHDAEISTTSATYVDTANKFHVTRPGSYRMKVELSRTGGITKARAIRKLKDGTVTVLTGEATQGTLTYPTFGTVQTLDFTSAVDWGDVIYMQLMNDSGPGQTGYAQNCRLYYQDATAALVPVDLAL